MSTGPAGISVRLALPEDGRPIAEIYGYFVENTFISFETEPPTAAIMEDRIRATVATHPFLIAEREGQIVGYAYAGRHRERAAYRWSVDVSVYVAPRAHRSGVGRALYDPLLRILREQRFHSAYAGISLPNAASVGLHEAMGFTPIGTFPSVGFKHGRWHSVGWWGRQLTNGDESPPAEPLLISSVELAKHLS